MYAGGVIVLHPRLVISMRMGCHLLIQRASTRGVSVQTKSKKEVMYLCKLVL